MSLFGGRKSGVDVVDFTKTKSGKPIAKPKETSPAPFVGGFLDFTQNSSQPTNTSQSDTPSTFGFLNDFAQSASGDSTTTDVTSRLSNPDAEVGALRLKIDDLEYKLERLLERLAEMETKFGRA